MLAAGGWIIVILASVAPDANLRQTTPEAYVEAIKWVNHNQVKVSRFDRTEESCWLGISQGPRSESTAKLSIIDRTNWRGLVGAPGIAGIVSAVAWNPG